LAAGSGRAVLQLISASKSFRNGRIWSTAHSFGKVADIARQVEQFVQRAAGREALGPN